jgi:gamma-glutamyl hydrolase
MFTHSEVRIGVLSSPSPYNNMHQAESYMNRDYLTWVEMSGAKAILVPYNTDKLRTYLDRLHGMVLCGGGIRNIRTHSSEQYKSYVNTVRKIYDYAVARSLPLWGTCLGFELLALMGDPPPIETFLSEENLQPVEKNGLSTLRFTDEDSRIKSEFSEAMLKKMAKKAFCSHVHKYGFRLEAEHLKTMKKYLNVVSVDKTHDGTPFVNIFEYKAYPFYGVQWHPEKIQNPLAEKVAEVLSKFFRKECAAHRGYIKEPLRIASGKFKEKTAVLVKGGNTTRKRTKKNNGRKQTCRSFRRSA